MEIIDAQVHIWERNHPGRPWRPYYGRATRDVPELTVETMVEAMARVGADAAVISTPANYGWDNSYSLEAAATYPGTFAVAGNVDPCAEDLDEQVRGWRQHHGALAIRIALHHAAALEHFREGVLDRLMDSAQRHEVPITLYPAGHLAETGACARRFPTLQLVLDHLGLPQPTPFTTRDEEPFERLPQLLDLAQFPNIAIKLTAAPTLSREAFPYQDLWPPLHRILDQFGVERVLWGSDWTRATQTGSYEQGLQFITDTDELSYADKEQILGASLRSVLRWPRHADAAVQTSRSRR